MQNVGAYGQDVAQTITRVRAFSCAERRVVEFDRPSCRFGYRHSIFRGSKDHVILDVTFSLAKNELSAPLRYPELARALGTHEGGRAPLLEVHDAVLALRRSKGMVLDPKDLDTRSAGSFFVNPLVDARALDALRARVESLLGREARLPVFPEPDGRTKVSAAWLIERAGFYKGFSLGLASISSKHALALTARPDATTVQLLTLARAIRDGVERTFGVVLEHEPVFVGVTL
jgi:UDP-N-acetylmuramate dehydrogenase